MKLAVQCDFDGTVIEVETSIILLEEFAEGNWKEIDDAFYAGRISVRDCTKQCFSMIKADKKTLEEFVLMSDRIKVRDGFIDFCNYCRQEGYYLVIVSNGLTFYIDAILNDLGVNNIEVFAAQNQFNPEGMKIEFSGPNGDEPETDFKQAYTELLKKQGYNVVCIGDSITDIYTARRADYIFATGNLREICRREDLEYTPFNTFYDVINSLKNLT